MKDTQFGFYENGDLSCPNGERVQTNEPKSKADCEPFEIFVERGANRERNRAKRQRKKLRRIFK